MNNIQTIIIIIIIIIIINSPRHYYIIKIRICQSAADFLTAQEDILAKISGICGRTSRSLVQSYKRFEGNCHFRLNQTEATGSSETFVNSLTRSHPRIRHCLENPKSPLINYGIHVLTPHIHYSGYNFRCGFFPTVSTRNCVSVVRNTSSDLPPCTVFFPISCTRTALPRH